MTPSDLQRLRDWFDGWCGEFTRSAPENDRRNYLLKEVHTRRVCEAAVAIATELGCRGGELLLAETVGLLHDVGRFTQYRDFRTFRDADSVNHAARSVRVIAEEHLLVGIPQEEQRLIIRSVALHNLYRMPALSDPREDFFLRLVRDADKLDIWRVFLEYYSLPEHERASAVGLGFPDRPGCSPEVLDTIAKGEMINLVNVKSLNDFKLLQLSWVFDLNYFPTRRMFRERGYLAAFAAVLPPSDAVRNAFGVLESHLCRPTDGSRAGTSGEPEWIR